MANPQPIANHGIDDLVARYAAVMERSNAILLQDSGVAFVRLWRADERLHVYGWKPKKPAHYGDDTCYHSLDSLFCKPDQALLDAEFSTRRSFDVDAANRLLWQNRHRFALDGVSVLMPSGWTLDANGSVSSLDAGKFCIAVYVVDKRWAGLERLPTTVDDVPVHVRQVLVSPAGGVYGNAVPSTGAELIVTPPESQPRSFGTVAGLVVDGDGQKWALTAEHVLAFKRTPGEYTVRCGPSVAGLGLEVSYKVSVNDHHLPVVKEQDTIRIAPVHEFDSDTHTIDVKAHSTIDRRFDAALLKLPVEGSPNLTFEDRDYLDFAARKWTPDDYLNGHQDWQSLAPLNEDSFPIVYKSGRTTALTRGLVLPEVLASTNFPYFYEPVVSRFVLYDLISSDLDGRAFCDGGDSGSLVFSITADNKLLPVGLLIVKLGQRQGLMTPIVDILEHFKVRFWDGTEIE